MIKTISSVNFGYLADVQPDQARLSNYNNYGLNNHYSKYINNYIKVFVGMGSRIRKVSPEYMHAMLSGSISGEK